MTIDVINQAPFLRTSREFPEEIRQLTVEVNRTYVDIASFVNARTIGLFPTNRAAINGESWFLQGNRRQQALRQVYPFTTTANIPLGFKISQVSQFSRLFGTYTDSAGRWYGILGATSVAIAGQIGFYIDIDGTSTTSDLIKFTTGAGAPTLTYGTIVVEWLSKV